MPVGIFLLGKIMRTHAITVSLCKHFIIGISKNPKTHE